MLEKFLYGHQDDSQTNYDALRYSIMLNGIAIIHLLFMILFYIMGVYFMGIYNTVIVILYFYMARIISDVKDLTKIYWILLGEVVLHSCLATIFVGWNFGFMYYLASLIPTSFYLAFSIHAFRRRLVFPFVSAGVIFFSYMVILTLAHFVAPVYPDTPSGFRVFLTYMNIIIGLSITFLFSALFAVEVNSMQLRMERNRAHNAAATAGIVAVEDAAQHVGHGRLALGTRQAKNANAAVRVAPSLR